MAKRPCLGVDGAYCGRLTERGDGRCSACASAWHRQRDARRGTARQRGYDTEHDKTRRSLLPKAYGQPCPRCGELMLAGQVLDLGHPEGQGLRVDRNARAERIEHAACNRGARD